MPSPFPGMDPFLEEGERWTLFHDWFVRELARLAMPRANALGLWLDVERNIYTHDADGEVVLLGAPDEVVGDADEAAWSPTEDRGGGVALAQPLAIHEVVLSEDERRHRQDYLVVREQSPGSPIVAVAEVLSPSNKSGEYQRKYLDKRARLLASSVHFLEIDLLRAGRNPSREQFPELPAAPYFIFVARQHGLGRTEEGYPLALQEPLPVIGLPLGRGRPDLPMDLAAAFTAAYDLSVQRRIDYAAEPLPARLSGEDQTWVKQLLNRHR